MLSPAPPILFKQPLSYHELMSTAEGTHLVGGMQLLQKVVDQLEAKNETLSNTVTDLRQLISRLAVEHAREVKRHQQTIKEHKLQGLRLMRALEAAETHAGHFENISGYWKEFV